MTDDFAPPPPSGEPVQPSTPEPQYTEPASPQPTTPPQEAPDLSSPPADTPTVLYEPGAANEQAQAPVPADPPVGEMPGTLPVNEAPYVQPVSEVLPVQSAGEAPGTSSPPMPPAQPYYDAGQMPPAPGVATYETPTGAEQASFGAPLEKKKKSKKPLIIILSVIAVIALCVAGFFIFQEVSRSNAYDQATASFNSGNYSQAESTFSELGDYRDAKDMAQLSKAHALFEEGKSLYDKGDYEEAKAKFALVNSKDLSDEVTEWMNKCDYALAEELFDQGDYSGAQTAFFDLGNYSDSVERVSACGYVIAEQLASNGEVEEAYEAFLGLGDYLDSAQRAIACTQPFPESGILFQNSDYYYDLCAIEIDNQHPTGAIFFKIYNGDAVVATMFINAGTTARVYLKPGDYTLKEGTGDIWFGEAVAFGKSGRYHQMTFSDTGTDYLTLADGDLMTITINLSLGSGNISDKREDYDSF